MGLGFWNKLKHGVRKVGNFIKTKILPFASKVVPAVASGIFGPGAGMVASKVFGKANDIFGRSSAPPHISFEDSGGGGVPEWRHYS